ncbi:MAG: GntP family permease [Cyclobacteriaceae bacterium]
MSSPLQITLGLLASITLLIIWPRFFKINSFFALLFASILYALIVGLPVKDTLNSMQSGFGSLLQQIGLLVALGSVLGTLLEKTGAMESISTGMLRLFGSHRSLLAMSTIGTVVGIPVFCDSGFIILSKLVPSLAAKTTASASSLSLGLSSGLYAAHTLVPPTPGPLAAAGNLGISQSIGVVMILGMVILVPVVMVSYFASRRLGLMIPNSLEASSATVARHIPFFKSLLPLALPILLIACGTLFDLWLPNSWFASVFAIMGLPTVALMLGVLLALTLVDRTKDKDWPEWVNRALLGAGLILLITGAGGAFGSVIKASGVANVIESFVQSSQASGTLFLLVAFAIAAVLKTAQGSSTSSIIITSSLLAPIATLAGIESTVDHALLVMAIGGGAMTVSHANDSYFWVVSQFGGIAPKHMYRSYTLLTFVQGATVLISAILLKWLL